MQWIKYFVKYLSGVLLQRSCLHASSILSSICKQFMTKTRPTQTWMLATFVQQLSLSSLQLPPLLAIL